MEPKSLPKMVKKSLKIDPKSTPALRRHPVEPGGFILEVRGSIFDFKM